MNLKVTIKDNLALLCAILILATAFWALYLGNSKADYHYLILSAISLATSLIAFVIAFFSKKEPVKPDYEQAKYIKLLERRVAATEKILEGVTIIDQHGCVIFMNRAFMDLFELSEKDRSGYENKPWSALVKDPEIYELFEVAEAQVKIVGNWSMVAKLRSDYNSNGSKCLRLNLIALDEGGYILTAHDNTDHEKALTQNKLMKDQLYQAQKMEAIGRLAGGMVHDLNNVLAAMNGYAGFLKEDIEEGTPQKEYAQNILKAGAQAKNLVDQMLAFSRNREHDFDVMDIKAPIYECLTMLKASLPASIKIKADFDNEPLLMEGNAMQISQVVMNICVNAMDAMGEDHGGELGLSIDLVNADACRNEFLSYGDTLPDIDGTPAIKMDEFEVGASKLYFNHLAEGMNYLRLNITDTGEGMTHSIMKKIFDPFFTSKPDDKGTGLGLSIVHNVMLAHRGAVKVHSAPGKGTVFSLYFPYAITFESDDDGKVKGGDYKLTKERILLIDDQEMVRFMTSVMLKRMGHQVEVASSGIEAIDILRKRSGDFNLVITDHDMPEMTGFDLVHVASKEYPDLPFIILSGYGAEKLEKLKQEHPNIKAVISKPAQKDELGEQIATVLSSCRSNDNIPAL